MTYPLFGLKDDYQYGNPPREGLHPSRVAKSKPRFSFSTKAFPPSERPPVITIVFAATTPENMPFIYRASTLANPNPMISTAFVEANYEDEEREMEPRPKPNREATPTLQPRSPMVRRQRERVVEFEEAPNREGSRRGRNAKGIWPSEIEAREDEYRGVNHPLLLAAHMGRNESDSARIWWNSQKIGSILNYEDLKDKFWSHFSQQNKFTKTHLAVHNIKQREVESTRAFVTRYTDDTLQISSLHEEQCISGFVHGLRTRSLVNHLSTDLPSTYKGLMEKTYTWIEAREVATNETPNDQRENFKRSRKSSWDNNRGQKGRDRMSHMQRIKSKASPLKARKLHSLQEEAILQHWSIVKIPLEITIGDPPLTRKETLNFVIIKSDSPYNMLLGRT
ncbi:putative reverse transcriptase domain-containing protein, partial [Tanacetum coccineum]